MKPWGCTLTSIRFCDRGPVMHCPKYLEHPRLGNCSSLAVWLFFLTSACPDCLAQKHTVHSLYSTIFLRLFWQNLGVVLPHSLQFIVTAFFSFLYVDAAETADSPMHALAACSLQLDSTIETVSDKLLRSISMVPNTSLAISGDDRHARTIHRTTSSV